MLALMRLGFSYTEARAMPAAEVEPYLEAWDELNNPKKETRTKVRKTKKA